MEKDHSKKKRYNPIIGITVIIFGMCTVIGYATAKKFDAFADSNLSEIEMLGKQIFFDEISSPPRQGCAGCHNPKAGWKFGVAGVNLHQVAITGANPLTVGSLQVPSNAYAPQEPFEPCAAGVPGFCAGDFWNGRAEGNPLALFPGGATVHVGDEVFLSSDTGALNPALAAYGLYIGPIADQAYNPFLNPVEQNNADQQAVCRHVESSNYAELFAIVWDEPINCSSDTYPGSSLPYYEINHRRIALSLAAWQMSFQVNSFSSKRDIALANDGDHLFPLDDFTDQENLGHDLFYNTLPVPFAPRGGFNEPPFPELPVTNCSFCHSDDPADTGVEPFQLYTDTAYHHIGGPVNTEIPDTGIDPDEGLMGHTMNPAHLGFFKTPTLRNVCKGTGEGFIKSYTHNGWFKSVESIVHFYNTALIGGATANTFGVERCPDGIETEKDALANNCWPAPHPGASAIGILVGNLGLSAEQEAAIVAYLHTLSDTYTPKAPKPFSAAP